MISNVLVLNKWDYRWLSLAKIVSSWSKDPSTQCGSVIANGKMFTSFGYNGFPSGIPDDESLHNRELKYQKIIHAEMNAILFAKQNIEGHTQYVYPLPPCSRCATMIIQSGITKVVSINIEEGPLKERWKDIEIAFDMFNEKGIEVLLLTPGII